MTRKQKKTLLRILAAAAMVLLLSLLPAEGVLRFALFLLPYLTIGYDILLKALHGLRSRQPFDENFLMAVATIGAMALGDYAEGVMVMLFYQIGELFQSYAVGKSRRSISALMDIRPDHANVEGENGALTQVDPDEVAVGTVIVVQPGEKVPIDGVVVSGETTLNTSALTGESVPRSVHPGDEIISGCINLTGLVKLRTTREFGESTVSKILELVENAGSRKSRSEHFISKFARIYTPVVCFSALALALLPPLVRVVLLQLPAQWGVWVYRALTFLVISCPCALVISIPLSFFAGLGGAGRAGILIKGSNYMESLARVKCVAFDKTGTVTRGVFAVSGVFPVDMDESALLEYAALAESYSNHPISKSLQAACPAADKSRVGHVEELSGHGILAEVDGVSVAVGNGRLMERLGVSFAECSQVGTVAHVAINGVYAGYILISDAIKPTAKDAIIALKRTGVRKTVMLTGDRKAVGEAVGKELGIDEIHTQLLPGDKVALVESLLAEDGKLAFAGDGVNDAPVLARADVGIAMGALGSDAAIEAADVVLMDDDPRKIALAIQIARKCIRIVYQNIYFALGVKFICLFLGAIGRAGMWAAVFADVGVMVLAVLNAMRALGVKKL